MFRSMNLYKKFNIYIFAIVVLMLALGFYPWLCPCSHDLVIALAFYLIYGFRWMRQEDENLFEKRLKARPLNAIIFQPFSALRNGLKKNPASLEEDSKRNDLMWFLSMLTAVGTPCVAWVAYKAYAKVGYEEAAAALAFWTTVVSFVAVGLNTAYAFFLSRKANNRSKLNNPGQSS